MTWLQTLQLLGPGLVALAGAWRAHSKTAARLAVLEREHADCIENVSSLRAELAALEAKTSLVPAPAPEEMN